jgi:hypothetical protein
MSAINQPLILNVVDWLLNRCSAALAIHNIRRPQD